MYHSLKNRIWFTIIFFPHKESLTLFQIWILFVIHSLTFPKLELSRIESPKLTPSILMKNCDHSFHLSWFINSMFICSSPQGLAFEMFIFVIDASPYSFKTTCILLRQVISLKKMAVSSAKFTILISWSPICIPLLLINQISKYLSCNNV